MLTEFDTDTRKFYEKLIDHLISGKSITRREAFENFGIRYDAFGSIIQMAKKRGYNVETEIVIYRKSCRRKKYYISNVR